MIMKNIRNIVELAMKFEKSNCNRSRCKLIEIKHMLFKK